MFTYEYDVLVSEIVEGDLLFIYEGAVGTVKVAEHEGR